MPNLDSSLNSGAKEIIFIVFECKITTWRAHAGVAFCRSIYNYCTACLLGHELPVYINISRLSPNEDVSTVWPLSIDHFIALMAQTFPNYHIQQGQMNDIM